MFRYTKVISISISIIFLSINSIPIFPILVRVVTQRGYFHLINLLRHFSSTNCQLCYSYSSRRTLIAYTIANVNRTIVPRILVIIKRLNYEKKIDEGTKFRKSKSNRNAVTFDSISIIEIESNHRLSKHH
jgi:hypothetical protein